MRFTLIQLATFCAVFNLEAEINGNKMCANCYDSDTGILINVVWLK